MYDFVYCDQYRVCVFALPHVNDEFQFVVVLDRYFVHILTDVI